MFGITIKRSLQFIAGTALAVSLPAWAHQGGHAMLSVGAGVAHPLSGSTTG